MSKLSGTGNAAETVREYLYWKCVERWNPFERKRTGCGKYFTADSKITDCPECGNSLYVVRLGEPLTDRVPRVMNDKCSKCANSVYALPCANNAKPAKPEYCVPCGCRACCAESAALYESMREGRVTLRGLFEESVRKRREAGAKPGPMAGIMGKVFDDEIPF